MSRRDPHIPLFLWVATAIVVHAIWGGGAQKAVSAIEETLDIGAFAKGVQRHVRQNVSPLEVTLEEPPDELEVQRPEPKPAEPVDPVDPTKTPDEAIPPEPEKKKKLEEEKKLAEEKKKVEEKKAEEKPEEKKPDEPKPPAPLMEPPKAPNRVAVQQHVKPDQEDNPDAAYIADEANHVEEETQARITATDQDSPEPTPGGNFAGTHQEPGNSEESRVAQSDDHAGDPERPGEAASQEPTPPTQAQPAQPPAGGNQQPRVAQNQQTAQAPRAAQTAQEASPDVHQINHGAWSFNEPNPGRAAQKALPERRAVRPTDLLGLGAPGVTKNGVNLNLTPQMAIAAVGVDQLVRERRLDGERRRSAHLGSWKSFGLERWRPALENYVASVKPGNQTALNAARVPFARYLNAIHNRLHPIFADRFLGSLDGLPANSPLNRQDMVTHLEIVLSKEDGHIVRMGVVKSSGVTAFDVGALDSVQKGSPYGVPPEAIVSPDGNVYLHWEFYRQPFYACSTYFAHPFMLKGTPKSPAPEVAPPTAPSYDEREGSGASPGERSGSLEQEHRRSPRSAERQPRG